MFSYRSKQPQNARRGARGRNGVLKRQDVFRRIKAATVAICHKENGVLIPFGSGINVDPDGFVITAKHVIESTMQNSIVRPSDGGTATGTVIQRQLFAVFCIEQDGDLLIWAFPPFVTGGLHSHDLAFIRIRVGEGAPVDTLPYVAIGDSDDVYEGEEVITCGFPLGKVLQPSVPTGSLFQEGIVSSIRPHALAKSRDMSFWI